MSAAAAAESLEGHDDAQTREAPPPSQARAAPPKARGAAPEEHDQSKPGQERPADHQNRFSKELKRRKEMYHE